MASFLHDPKKGRARFFFRFGGRQHNKTVPVAERREAERLLARLEDALKDVELGRLEFPGGSDPAAFFLSGGKIVQGKGSPHRPGCSSIGELLEAYEADPPPHLEPSTRKMQGIHGRRILEVIKASTPLGAFDAQGYASSRAKVKYRGRAIHRDTIAKELKTLRQAWTWVASRNPGVGAPCFELADVKLPKASPLSPFMTWAEIELEAGRGGGDELWDCLWLERPQVKELLEHSKASSKTRCLPAMLMAAAYTGMRRSELCRSQVSDWRLEDGVVRARQKKRDLEREYTIREIPIHPDLLEAFKAWLELHPGGPQAFALEDGSPMTWRAATYQFIAAVEGSKWKVVKGWHVLRHSFASNLAISGVDQRIIDKWMGHSTSIRLRYQHLRPQDQRDAIALL